MCNLCRRGVDDKLRLGKFRLGESRLMSLDGSRGPFFRPDELCGAVKTDNGRLEFEGRAVLMDA